MEIKEDIQNIVFYEVTTNRCQIIIYRINKILKRQHKMPIKTDSNFPQIDEKIKTR